MTLHLNGLARGSGKASEESRQVIWPENWSRRNENPRIRRGLNLMPEQVIATSSNGHAIEVSLVDDAVSALINLGYKPAEAKRALVRTLPTVESQGLVGS